MDYPDELMALLQPGRKVRMNYGVGNPNNELRHVRAIVDDDQIVYRVWQYRRWIYHVRWAYAFLLAWQDGNVTKA
jgi:hypothetical protein